jgi:predicted AAA+ superfamily ATPase
VKRYLPRLLETCIEERFVAKGGILIEGPKWCGKSTTSKRFAGTVVELQKSNVLKQYEMFVAMGDENMFRGEKPIMFDEWQEIPEPWDNIRAYIDGSGERGNSS